MADSFDTRLLRRALGEKRSHRSIKPLYGHRSWVEDLDIVNELGGHTGCVNALSWSSSGNLLASGSDDTYLNIWSYNPANLAKPFTLNTSVSTGHDHHSNIFSVKFMPHSNDRTVVTCAGDAEVRVFDLEHASANQPNSGSDLAGSTRSRRFNKFFSQARWLSDANTNARIYRSHADRAKRIVTESSPFLFLTCSEDGEVRQWDLRLPSSAYPAPKGARGVSRYRRDDDGSDDVPPPLISYKKYGLDLNSISCAPSQPQYIALGGAHLHCFLHDRRMLGRDTGDEMGQPGNMPTVGMHEDEAMASATKCVKRFAPNSRRRMSSNDHGHITACKISDANPNEMLASWSGDHVYSFDLIRAPDARDADAKQDESFQISRLKNHADRKRKRRQAATSSSSLADYGTPARRLRRVSDSQREVGHTALRVGHENSDSEDMATVLHAESSIDTDVPGDFLLEEAQTTSDRVARSVVQLRKTIFDFSASLRVNSGEGTLSMERSSELTPHTTAFSSALSQCCTLLPQLDEIIRNWSYPVNPDPEDVALQNTLRRNRQETWRFVQAAGCLSRVLGGKLQTTSAVHDPRIGLFDQIRPAAHEGKTIQRNTRFCYDFLKAILVWLSGGSDAVLKAFVRPPSIPPNNPRFPLADNDTNDTFVPKLHAYLSELADEDLPVLNLDTNAFEHDERRQVFASQKAAVLAFTRALAGVDLQLHHGPAAPITEMSSPTTAKHVMDKGAAARFWGVKVGRSLLMEAATGVTFDFVNRAFGGLRLRLHPEPPPERRPAEVDSTEPARIIQAAGVVQLTLPEDPAPSNLSQGQGGTEATPPPTVAFANVSDVESEEGNHNEQDFSGDADESDDDDSNEDEAALSLPRRRMALASRNRDRASVNINVPYSSHVRVYKGHCNTRTVKDVNYYGLDDEYVVSGSDDGHFFIWDRKTSKIVNILLGDGEVVNVVQGHPYEPMIACSGIDSTIKIFGPGGESRERSNAVRGIDVANPSGVAHSSLPFGRRQMRRNARDDSDDEAETANGESGKGTDDENHAVSSRGLRSRKAMNKIYEITSQNDAERRRGLGDAFMTEGMLARFAAALQRGQVQAGPGGTIVVDDQNCLIM